MRTVALFEHRWTVGEACRFHLQIGKPRVGQRTHARNRQANAGRRRVAGHVEGLHEKQIIAGTSAYATSYARLAPSLLNDAEEIDLALSEIRAMG